MKKSLMSGVVVAAIGLMASSANAQFNFEGSYGWEDGGTILGQFGDNLTTENSGEHFLNGDSALKMIESPENGTPQAYVAWVTNLVDGDEITASIWVYDTTPDVSPSGRIWGHYSLADDINAFKGSASGNFTFSEGNGWSFLEWTWTFDSDGDTRDALVVETRIYSAEDGDVIYVDDVSVKVTSAANEDVVITFPSGNSQDCLDLAVENLVAGQKASFTISNGTPGAKVVTVYGFDAGQTLVNEVAGYCADFGINGVKKNRVLGGLKIVFDGAGVATFDQGIPANAAGVNVLFQSAENGTCPDDCTSAVLEMVIG